MVISVRTQGFFRLLLKWGGGGGGGGGGGAKSVNENPRGGKCITIDYITDKITSVLILKFRNINITFSPQLCVRIIALKTGFVIVLLVVVQFN